jgi:hypothetical protein
MPRHSSGSRRKVRPVDVKTSRGCHKRLEEYLERVGRQFHGQSHRQAAQNERLWAHAFIFDLEFDETEAGGFAEADPIGIESYAYRNL